MLTNAQLNSIGFTFIQSEAEPFSPYGAELARRPHFYTPDEHNLLVSELENIGKLFALREQSPDEFRLLERALMQFKDVRRSIERSREFTLTDVEFFEIKRFLICLEGLSEAYSRLLKEDTLNEIRIEPFTEALNIVDPDGMRAMTFRVSDTCSQLLCDIRRERKQLDLLIRSAGADEKEKLIVRRSILVAKEADEEARIRTEMTHKFAEYANGLLSVTESIAKLDYAAAKSLLMKRFHGRIPKVELEGKELSFLEMINPKVEAVLKGKEMRFTPLSIALRAGTTVITGANMGGKSVAVKTLALNTLLALYGFPVFCARGIVPHFSEVDLLCEDMEDQLSGLSSFGGEMVHFDKIIRSSSSGTKLILLDEFARGTNPHEGSALVRAAVRFFNAREDSFALITTHFDFVASLASAHYQVMGLRNADKEELKASLQAGGEMSAAVLEKFMDYGLYPVEPDVNPPRDAITICRALNVSDEFMKLVDDENN